MSVGTLIDGKRVAVVGNATSLRGKGHGALIETCDIILRMNRGLPEYPADQGMRTDVLVFSVLPLVSDIYQQFNSRQLMWMSPKERSDVIGNIEYYNIERWNALHAKLGSRPSVGAMVLDLMTSLSPKDVHIFGYDFKKSGTIYQDHQHVGPHNYAAEEVFCRNVLSITGWTFHAD